MQTPIKLQQGQRVNLVQVTGNTSISGYLDMDLYFHTPDDHIKIIVEACVVKGMSTPLISGNDVADQYSILVIHQEGSCMIEFGESDPRMPVNNSVSPPFLEKDGHTFKLHVLNSSVKSTHQKNQRFKCKTKLYLILFILKLWAKFIIFSISPRRSCQNLQSPSLHLLLA